MPAVSPPKACLRNGFARRVRVTSATGSDGTSAPGFTLLEVVVALAIAALALIGLFRAGSGGLFAADTAARIDEAIERAQSHLAAFGRAGAITPGEFAGDDGGGYRWLVRVRSIAQQTVAVQPRAGQPLNAQQQIRPTLALYEVEVMVSWRSGGHNRSVTLETRRLGAAPASE